LLIFRAFLLILFTKVFAMAAVRQAIAMSAYKNQTHPVEHCYTPAKMRADQPLPTASVITGCPLLEINTHTGIDYDQADVAV
jgi:hypothetical protein